MNKNFINFHVLMSHSPSCINRDDMNMQKDAVFGGKRRVRISSQSIKRAIRESDYYKANIGKPSIRTIRFDLLLDKIKAELSGKFSEEVLEKTTELLAGTLKEKKGDASKKEINAVTPWSINEVAYIAELVQSIGADKPIADLAKELKKEIKDAKGVLGNNFEDATDIALSGRMTTSGLLTHVDGALAVAHAITTHAMQNADIDWFTAVDDLIQENNEIGAGHINAQEFSAGVFYRYASLNLSHLQKNLGGAPRDKMLEIAGHALYLLATVVPSGKQQSFAAFNPADYALVTVSDMPISLANAFEDPVNYDRNGGYLVNSIYNLNQYWERIKTAYGKDDSAMAFSVQELPDTRIETSNRIQDVVDWIAADAQH